MPGRGDYLKVFHLHAITSTFFLFLFQPKFTSSGDPAPVYLLYSLYTNDSVVCFSFPYHSINETQRCSNTLRSLETRTELIMSRLWSGKNIFIRNSGNWIRINRWRKRVRLCSPHEDVYGPVSRNIRPEMFLEMKQRKCRSDVKKCSLCYFEIRSVSYHLSAGIPS